MGITFINPFLVSPLAGDIYISNKQVNTAYSGTSPGSNIILPSGIVSGDLLLAFHANQQARSATWPAGWNEIYDAGAVANNLSIGWRIADGTEGASITLTMSGAVDTQRSIVLVIKNHAAGTSAPAVGTAASGTSVNPNPPSITPSWGASVKTLYVAVHTRSVANDTPSAYPTNYSVEQTNAAAASSGTRCMSLACRVIAGSPEDPGTFTIPTSVAWRAQTVAVRGLV